MKNVFNGLISKLDMDEQRISDISIESLKTEKQRK